MLTAPFYFTGKANKWTLTVLMRKLIVLANRLLKDPFYLSLELKTVAGACYFFCFFVENQTELPSIGSSRKLFIKKFKRFLIKISQKTALEDGDLLRLQIDMDSENQNPIIFVGSIG